MDTTKLFEIASASFLAHVAVGKYSYHLPLYRMVGIFGRVCVAIPISALSDWMHHTALLLRPIREALRAEILAGESVRLDDTRREMQRRSSTYLHADISLKKRALARDEDDGAPLPRLRATDSLLAFLQIL